MPLQTARFLVQPRQWRDHLRLMAAALAAEAAVVEAAVNYRGWLTGSLGVLSITLPMLFAVTGTPPVGIIAALGGSLLFIYENQHAAVPLTTLNEVMVIVSWTLTTFVVAVANDRQHRARDQLTELLLSAEGEERRRIANDLHDDTVQVVVAALLALDTLPAETRQSSVYTQSTKLLRQALERLRQVSFQLKPPTLESGGLQEALPVLCRQYHDRFEQIHCELGCSIQITGRGAPVIEELAHRVCLEALQNAWKHSHACHVHVTATTTSSTLHLTVSDDGRGFDTGQAPTGQEWDHLGLRAKLDRVLWVGGRFTVTSSPGRGTTISLDLPFIPRPNGDAGKARPRPRV